MHVTNRDVSSQQLLESGHFWVAGKIYPRVRSGQHKLWTTFVVGDTDKSIQQLSALHTGTRTVSIRFSFIFM